MTLVSDKADFVFSTQGRAGTPDGNIFLDVSDPANPKIELLASDEVAQVDYGSGLEANRLDPNDGATQQAIYGAIGVERRDNEVARQYRKPGVGRFALAGAYDLLNNWQYAGATDLGLVRGSGLRYLSVNGDVNRIYFGPKSLGNIELTSQPYYQTTALGTATDFGRLGPIDELVQTFGTTAFGDTGAGDFDVRPYHAVSIREWGFIHDRKTLVDSGLSEAGNFSGGFGLSEAPHPTTGTYLEADVFGGAAVGPWDVMTYETLGAPVTRSGFNEVDGDFTEVITNPSGGTLDEVVAYMDALARATVDIDTGTPSQIGKEVDVLYTFDAQGNIVLKQGLYIEGLPGADLTRLRLTDDAGNPKTFPSLITINTNLSLPAQGESTAWYHAFIEDDTDADDYNTATAITAQDKDGVEVKGTVGALSTVTFDVNYSAVPGGTNIPASTPYTIRFIVGDDPDTTGGPVENFALITIDGSASVINVDLSNDVENNV